MSPACWSKRSRKPIHRRARQSSPRNHGRSERINFESMDLLSGSTPRSRRLHAYLHPLRIHAMKCMHAFLLLHAVAAPRIAARTQILLHALADGNIFDLDLVAEFHRSLRRRAAMFLLRQIPFKNRQRALRLERQHNIQRNIVGIAVQHPVGKNPEIVGRQILARFLISARSRVPRLRPANRD